MKSLVLIDGVNFFYRGSWTLSKSFNPQGTEVTCVRCFLVNLLNMMKRLGLDSKYVVCWDGGYNERMRISSQAVADGIVPKSYKQERREAREMEDAEQALQSQSFVNQIKMSKEILSNTIVAQSSVQGEEADDVIGSLAKKYCSQYDKVLLVTTDRDYYQLLDKNIVIYNSGKNEYKDLSFLKKEYNLSSGQQWVDVGALAGESGASSDTIYGVPGIGYLTAAKLIAQYGTLDNLLTSTRYAIALDIKKFNNDVVALYNAVKSKQYKMRSYVKELNVLAHERIVEVAKKLKQMRTWLNVELPEATPDWLKLKETCSLNNLSISDNDISILAEN